MPQQRLGQGREGLLLVLVAVLVVVLLLLLGVPMVVWRQGVRGGRNSGCRIRLAPPHSTTRGVEHAEPVLHGAGSLLESVCDQL